MDTLPFVCTAKDTARDRHVLERIEDVYRVNSSIAGRRRVVVRCRAKLCNGLTSIPRGIPGKQTGTARSTCLSKLSVGEFCRMREERMYERYTVCRNGHGHGSRICRAK